MADPQVLAGQAARTLADRTGVDGFAAAVVLGSGWSPAADAIGEPRTEVSTADLVGFPPPVAEGHRGKVRHVEAGDRDVLVFLGRTHLYEEHGVGPVAHAVRVAAAAGCRILVLTNGAGGLRESWGPGTPVLIRDHINLTGRSPLVGARFVDLTQVYSPRLRELCRQVEPDLDEGVYVQFPGPHYETPAEIAMVRAIGGDLVGMSTAVEAIAAREADLEVLGISLVTNLAAGISGELLAHEEVLAAGRAAAPRLGELLRFVLAKA